MLKQTKQVDELLVDFLPKFRTWALAITRNRTTADDLVQITAEKIVTNKDDFVPGTNFSAWSHRIMLNKYRSMARNRGRFAEVNVDAVVYDARFSIKESQEDRELVRELGAAMARLPREQREALQMIVLDETSYESASEIACVSINTLKSRVHRARQNLAEFSYKRVATPDAQNNFSHQKNAPIAGYPLFANGANALLRSFLNTAGVATRPQLLQAVAKQMPDLSNNTLHSRITQLLDLKSLENVKGAAYQTAAAVVFGVAKMIPESAGLPPPNGEVTVFSPKVGKHLTEYRLFRNGANNDLREGLAAQNITTAKQIKDALYPFAREKGLSDKALFAHIYKILRADNLEGMSGYTFDIAGEIVKLAHGKPDRFGLTPAPRKSGAFRTNYFASSDSSASC